MTQMTTDVFKEDYNNVQEENERYKKLISLQKTHMASLDKELQITVSERRTQETLTVPCGLLKHQDQHCRQRKRIRILENKLNRDTIKFDELLWKNKDYRKAIAHLQQDKGTGYNREKKCNRQLVMQKILMEELEGKITVAFKQRTDAETQMLEERDSLDVETLQFSRRRMQLNTVIDHDAKLHTFMEKKLKEIIPLEEDDDSKKRKKQRQYENEAKKLEMYLQGHSTMVSVTGESDLHQLGHVFNQDELKNFAFINYINELHKRKNVLKSCKDRMKSDIQLLEQENKEHDKKNSKPLEQLESELERSSRLADFLEEQCTMVQKTLDELKMAITSLLAKIMHEPVILTFDNIVNFIRITEKNISTLLIQANMEDDKLHLSSQKLLLANSNLLQEVETVVEIEHGRTSSCSVKST